MAFLAKFKGKISSINRQGDIGESAMKAPPVVSKAREVPHAAKLPEAKTSPPELASPAPAVGTTSD
jgi:hypothetical protein